MRPHSAEWNIFDLETRVAPEKKDRSRLLVRNTLRQINFFGAGKNGRINQAKTLEDLHFVVPHNLILYSFHKCENGIY